MDIVIREQTLTLLAERAVYWKDKNTLILSDIHLGKATYFQMKGVAVPEEALYEDLERLKQLIDRFQPDHCLIVGDLIHANLAITEDHHLFLERWFNHITKTQIHLIFGNHDRHFVSHLHRYPHLQFHKEGHQIDPFFFAHYPQIKEGNFVWSGHLHPCYALKKYSFQLKLPCFAIGKECAILPAFSSFVGYSTVTKNEYENIYVIGDKEVIKI